METQHPIIQILSNLSLVNWIILSAFYFLTVIISTSLFSRCFLRRQWRFYKNLKRSVFIITPTDAIGSKIARTEMDLERKMLKQNGFLKIDDDVTDYRTFNPNNNHCIVVVGYHQNMKGLDEILIKVKYLQIPLIIYTYGENISVISESDKDKMGTYPLTIYANFQLTLLNQIFATLATFPYQKNVGH